MQKIYKFLINVLRSGVHIEKGEGYINGQKFINLKSNGKRAQLTIGNRGYFVNDNILSCSCKPVRF